MCIVWCELDNLWKILHFIDRKFIIDLYHFKIFSDNKVRQSSTLLNIEWSFLQFSTIAFKNLIYHGKNWSKSFIITRVEKLLIIFKALVVETPRVKMMEQHTWCNTQQTLVRPSFLHTRCRQMRSSDLELDTNKNYLLKVIIRNIRQRCNICSKLTIKKLEWSCWGHLSSHINGIFQIVSF